MDKKQFAAAFFVLVGFLVLVHQYVNWGTWFDLSDVHHETFAVGFFSLAAGIIIGKVRWR